MKTHSHNALLNYIDDHIYVSLPSNIDQSYQLFLSLLADLGLQTSKSKLVPPSTEVICLGILINTVAKTISIPRKSYWKLRHYVKIGKVNISVQKMSHNPCLDHCCISLSVLSCTLLPQQNVESLEGTPRTQLYQYF